jgi:hypothetical protein
MRPESVENAAMSFRENCNMTRLDFWRLAAIVLLLPVALAAQQKPLGIEGRWRGTLTRASSEVPLLLIMEKSGERYSGDLVVVAEGKIIPISSVRVKENSLHIEFSKVTYDGVFSTDRLTLNGTLTQGETSPLVFTREKTVTAAGSNHEPTIDMAIPIAPTAFRGEGKTHFAYELNIRNTGDLDVNLKEIDILGDGMLASFAGRDLDSIMTTVRIPGGARGIAFLWVTLPETSKIPATIHHRVIFNNKSFEGAPVDVVTKPVPVLGPPIRGDGWFAGNGPSNQSIHRRALFSFGDTARIAQRFAIDWVQVVPNNSTRTGDSKDNRSYHAYGAEALAVADAVVTTIKDGIPQNIPGDDFRAVTITRETIGGNVVTLDIGQGDFAVYAHLQPGSLRLKVGNRVKKGQVLGLVGNSGNSTEPHLHFQVVDHNSLLESEGVPYAFESFEVRGKDKKYQKRERQLPMDSEIIRFN